MKQSRHFTRNKVETTPCQLYMQTKTLLVIIVFHTFGSLCNKSHFFMTSSSMARAEKK